MRLKAFGVKSRLFRQVQRVEREPLCKALGAVVLQELDTRLVGEGIGRKRDVEDCQNLMPWASFMGINILHEDRRAEDLDRYPEFFTKFAYDGCLSGLAKFDRTA